MASEEDDLDAFFDEVDEVEQEALKEEDDNENGNENEKEVGEQTKVQADNNNDGNDDGERPLKKAKIETSDPTEVSGTAAASSSTTGRGTVVVSKKATISAPPTTSTNTSLSTTTKTADGIYQITVPENLVPSTSASAKVNANTSTSTIMGMRSSAIPPPPPPPPMMPNYNMNTNGNTAAGGIAAAASADHNHKPAIRIAAGKTWVDTTLSEFPPNDFRLFVGNLAKEITEEKLKEVFGSKYESFAMCRIIYDKLSNESKGYGFVSVMDPKDCARAIREMDGAWLGARPIKVKRSDWKERDLREVRKHDKKNKKRGGRNSRYHRR